jgi:hypothetical protein
MSDGVLRGKLPKDKQQDPVLLSVLRSTKLTDTVSPFLTLSEVIALTINSKKFD